MLSEASGDTDLTGVAATIIFTRATSTLMINVTKNREVLFSLMNLALTGLSFVVAFVLAEALLRYLETVKVTQNAPLAEFAKAIYMEQPEKLYLYSHKPNVKVRFQDSLKKVDFTFVTNASGLREEKEYQALERSVIFVGDSVIEGSPSSNSETIDSFFEELTGIVSLNFGIGSTGTINQNLFLADKYRSEYNAKIIFLGFCLNDIHQNETRRRFDSATGLWGPEEASDRVSPETIKSRLLQLRLVTFIWQLLYESGTLSYAYDSKKVSSEMYKSALREISKMKSFASSIGAEFVVVLLPSRTQIEARQTTDRVQDALIEMFRAVSIGWIDLAPLMLKQHPLGEISNLFHDDIHLTRDGNKLVAKILAQDGRVQSSLGIR